MPKPSFPRPEGHHSITPGFAVPNTAEVLRWLERAFEARVVERYDGPDGSIAHAEVMIDGSVVMCGDPMFGAEPMPAALSYYVDDGEAVDRVYRRAIEAGASSVSEPADQFYGYRSATVRDVGGNRWTICAVIEELTPAQMQERMQAMMSGDH